MPDVPTTDDAVDHHRFLRWLIQCLGMAAVYYACGKLALLLAIPPGYATAVWPAAGVALAAVLLMGYRVLPGVSLGSFLVNIGTSWDSSSWHALAHCNAVAVSIGAGAGIEAGLGAFLIRRYVGFPTALMQERDVVAFMGIGGPLACIAGATWGVATLVAAHVISSSGFGFSWWNWWVGDAIGVMIFTPLLLLFFSKPRELWLKRRVTVGIPLCGTFAIAVILFIYASSLERNQQRENFRRKAEVISQACQRQLDADVETLRSVQALFSVAGPVDRDQFRRFVTRLLAEHPGMKLMAWLPRVLDADRQQWEQAIRGRRADGLGISQQNGDHHLVSATQREEYFPIRFIEPEQEHAAVLGFDGLSELMRATAIKQALDTGQPAVSDPFTTIQAQPAGPAVIICMPVYTRVTAVDTTAATPNARQLETTGIVMGGFAPLGLISETLATLDTQGIEVWVVDDAVTGPDRFLYPLKSITASLVAPTDRSMMYSGIIRFAGRQWTLRAVYNKEYLVAHPSLSAWAVLAGGLLFTGLLGGFLLLLTGRTTRIEVEVDNRTIEIRSLAGALEFAKDSALAASDAKSLFLANMSHEIRSPLTAVIGYSDLLLNPKQKHMDPKEGLEIIRSNATHLLALINDILDLSKIEASDDVVRKEKVDLPALLTEVERTMRPLAAEKNLGFEIQCNGHIPRQIQSDPMRLRQILVNLVGNGLKFTEAGSVRIILSTGATQPGEAVQKCNLQFDVIDTGIGLTPGQIGSLFRSFSQVDPSRSRRYCGTGLGLALSQQLAVLLDGEIGVQSQPGAGSTFTLSIAVDAETDVEMFSQLQSIDVTAIHDGQRQHASVMTGRILLAEDGRDNARYFGAVLGDAGLQVEIAENGQRAVELAAHRKFDLILMDLNMPVLDGFGAASKIRMTGSQVPILALTANVFDVDRDRELKVGISEYLSKPIEPALLLAAVGRHIHTKSTAPFASRETEIANSAACRRSTHAHSPRWAKLLAEYTAELPGDVAMLSNLFARKQTDELAAMLHQIKGSGGNYGFPEITELAGIAEQDVLHHRDESARQSVLRLLQFMRSIDGYNVEQENGALHL